MNKRTFDILSDRMLQLCDKGTREELVLAVHELMGWIIDRDDAVDYYKAIFDGSWSGGAKLLKHALAKYEVNDEQNM